MPDRLYEALQYRKFGYCPSRRHSIHTAKPQRLRKARFYPIDNVCHPTANCWPCSATLTAILGSSPGSVAKFHFREFWHL